MKDNSGKIILALLAGASAGIVAGLLMAPETGTVSRDNLKKYAGKLSKDLERAVQENLNKLSNINPGDLINSAGSLLGLSKTGDAADGGSAGGAGGGSAAGGGATDSAAGTGGGNASGSAAGRTGTDASAGSAPKGGRAAGGTNPTGAGPEVGEDG